MHRGHPYPHAGNALSDWTDMQIETVEALALDCPYQVVLVHPKRFCFSQSNRNRL